MVENAPLTDEGWAAWHLGERSCRQLRTAGMGQPVGIDLGVALTMAAAEGADMAAMGELLPAYEAGLVSGLRKMIDRKDPDQ